ncbi:iron uptake system protein EfeO [Peribacillus sp. B-H-3]|jgi:iron uptake system component EfeO|uniref:iron uptake system protein EfeO n=1 Tax=Peribacillus sp. B-H-3 TaxID=3400420 RepID=UPI003B025058
MKHLKKTAAVLVSISLLAGCAGTKETKSPDKESAKPAESVSEKELKGVSSEYREYALGQIEEFVKATENFTNAVKSGNLKKAQELYGPARMYYERSEPIAEAFGDLDPKIDAREGDVPEKTWTGYHRIEKGLWVDKTTKGSEIYADQLMKDVTLLRAKVEAVEVTPELLITGAVDLLNEVSTSKVTGEEDQYSHTDLYDFAANVQGAEKIYLLLKPVLEKKDPAVSENIAKHFQAVYSLLNQHKQGNGYKLYTELKEDEVKQLSQAIDALAEPLSQIGIVTGES